MEKVMSFFEFDLTDNQIIVDADKSEMKDNSSITFLGKNNVLYIEDGVRLSHSSIKFFGSNSLIYLRRSKYTYIVIIDVYNDSTVYIGENCFFNKALHMIASEHQNIIIGDDCLFSFGVFIRTTDAHVIYDCVSKERINQSASVFIGDHVWVGQNALLLKGTKIGSGAIIGGGGCVAGKTIPSNVSAVGNPAKIRRRNVFFLHDSVQKWTEDVTKRHMKSDTDEYIFCFSTDTVDMDELDALLKASGKNGRLEQTVELLVKNKAKNRFAIPYDEDTERTTD